MSSDRAKRHFIHLILEDLTHFFVTEPANASSPTRAEMLTKSLVHHHGVRCSVFLVVAAGVILSAPQPTELKELKMHFSCHSLHNRITSSKLD